MPKFNVDNLVVLYLSGNEKNLQPVSAVDTVTSRTTRYFLMELSCYIFSTVILSFMNMHENIFVFYSHIKMSSRDVCGK